MTFKINLKGDFCNAQKLSHLLLDFESDIDVQIDRYTVDGKSLLGLLSLSIEKDLTVTVHEKIDGETVKIRELMRTNGFLIE